MFFPAVKFGKGLARIYQHAALNRPAKIKELETHVSKDAEELVELIESGQSPEDVLEIATRLAWNQHALDKAQRDLAVDQRHEKARVGVSKVAVAGGVSGQEGAGSGDGEAGGWGGAGCGDGEVTAVAPTPVTVPTCASAVIIAVPAAVTVAEPAAVTTTEPAINFADVFRSAPTPVITTTAAAVIAADTLPTADANNTPISGNLYYY
jgi:hypothetical protein